MSSPRLSSSPASEQQGLEAPHLTQPSWVSPATSNQIHVEHVIIAKNSPPANREVSAGLQISKRPNTTISSSLEPKQGLEAHLTHPAPNQTDAMEHDRVVNHRAANKEVSAKVQIPKALFNTTTPATRCLLELQDKKNHLIDVWLELRVPILEAVIEAPRVYYVHFIVMHLEDEKLGWKADTWNCNYGHAITKQEGSGSKVENNAKFHHELGRIRADRQRNQVFMYVLECPKKTQTSKQGDDLLLTSVSPSNKTSIVKHEIPVYETRKYVECDRLERDEFLDMRSQIATSAQHDSINETVAKMGSCMIARGDEWKPKLPEWIEYHRLVGFQHFWIYLNEPWTNLTGLPQHPYVTYIPFDFFWGDHRDHAPYFRQGVPIFWQIPMQMACIYKAKRYGLDWVTTTDVDEFVNVAVAENKSSAVQEGDRPLAKYLEENYSQKSCTGLVMKSVPFGRNKWLEPRNMTVSSVLDYTYRVGEDPEWDRQKFIYRPSRIWFTTVHTTAGAELQTEIYLQHYKNAHKRVFHKGKVKPEMLVQDTDLRDRYRDRILQNLNKTIKFTMQ